MIVSKKNSGLRAVGKFCLNSILGRFTKRADHLVTEFVNNPVHFYCLVNGSDVELQDLCILNNDFVGKSKVSNTFIGILQHQRKRCTTKLSHPY